MAQPQVIRGLGQSQLKYMVLTEGLTIPEGYDVCPYRGYVWSILSNVSKYPTHKYAELIASAPNLLAPETLKKIKDDTFRTLAGDEAFHARVNEKALLRVLSAVAITLPQKTTYVQGMNVLLAPIMFAFYKSEPQAYAVFYSLVTEKMPLYVSPNLEGALTGADLVDAALQLLDSKLYTFLSSRFLKAKIYAFPLVMTLCASVQPLDAVLRLWDIMFAFGTHLNIFFIVSLLITNKRTIMRSHEPMSVIKKLRMDDEVEVIKHAMTCIPRLPRAFYSIVSRHGFDENVPHELADFMDEYQRSVTPEPRYRLEARGFRA